MCVCDVSQSLCDTLVERKCEWSRRGSVKFPSEGFQLCFRRFRAGVSCGADRVMPWAELGDDRGPAAFPSPSPAVLCIIIHSSPRPQTPPSHHLSCRCHSDFERDLSSSCPPVRSTALMGKCCSETRGKNTFCFHAVAAGRFKSLSHTVYFTRSCYNGCGILSVTHSLGGLTKKTEVESIKQFT